MKSRWALLSVFFLTGCGGDGNLLHYFDYDPNAQPLIDKEYSIKEIAGEEGFAQVDIVWVIDNSGSMGDFQKEVSKNTSVFMDEFRKSTTVDWRMGLVSTDRMDSPYLWSVGGSFFGFQSPNPVQVFQTAVSRLGTYGSATEQPFLSLKKALDQDTGMIRPHASLVVIMVTDAEEQSDQIDSQEMLDYLVNLKGGNLKKVQVYGAFAPNDFGCDPTPGGERAWYYSTSKYRLLVEKTQGLTFALCTADFGKELAKIGKYIVSFLVKPKLYLEKRPKPETIRVFFRDQLLPGGPKENGGFWFYDYALNAVVFYSLDFTGDGEESVRVEFKEDDGY